MKIQLNWVLIIVGGVFIIVELLLGAAAGFDFVLLGLCLVAGGGLGLLFGSTQLGLFSAGALGILYMLVLRRWIRSRLTPQTRPTGADALIGRSGRVTVRIAPHEPGQVRLDEEVWRAALAPGTDGAREPGATVTVQGVDGITLLVK
jgi:membrane protein implicated in regulation of membrane protease activity